MLMKRLLFLCLGCLLSLFSFSQELGNIYSEQDGEKINIYYSILNAGEGQTFKISVSCATENRRFVLKTVSGDVGDSITSGRFKKIIWDVLKDVDELGEAEFFVKIEKINEAVSEEKMQQAEKLSVSAKTDISPSQTRKDFSQTKKFILAFDGSYGLNRRGYSSGFNFIGNFSIINPYVDFSVHKYSEQHFSEHSIDVGLTGFSASGGFSLKLSERLFFLAASGYNSMKITSQLSSQLAIPNFIGRNFQGWKAKSGLIFVNNRIVFGLGSIYLRNGVNYFGLYTMLGFTL